MSNIKLDSDNMEMWLVCTAIGKNHKLIDKMQKNEDETYDVVFSVGGVELDFHRVAERIQEEVDRISNSVNERAIQKAKELVTNKYGNLLDEIEDIQERIERQKELFKDEWD